MAAGHSYPPTPEGTEACGSKEGIRSNSIVFEATTGQEAGAHQVVKSVTGMEAEPLQFAECAKIGISEFRIQSFLKGIIWFSRSPDAESRPSEAPWGTSGESPGVPRETRETFERHEEVNGANSTVSLRNNWLFEVPGDRISTL